jgi:ribose 5-phosphate isomerase B
MKVAIGADHAGCALKSALADHLRSRGHEVADLGTDDPGRSADYPVFAFAVARAVGSGEADLGVLACGTGIGMSIAANKVRGVRAALCHDVTTARLAREHNDANVFVVGARLLAVPLAIELLDAFLDARFEPRHQRRLDLIAREEGGGPR